MIAIDLAIYENQVIDAASLHSKPNCYFIGPFAKRVSFASQQFRVMDLVAALQKKKNLEGAKVAVVGAGLSGLTATAALRGIGCKLHLYEANEGPLLRQINAKHRVVHPTISRWPIEPLELTTQLPFFDWFAGPCDEIMHSLRSNWAAYFEPSLDDDFKFLPNTKVEELFIPKSEQEFVQLRTSPYRTGVSADFEKYEYVFVTTGFGQERELGALRCDSYWAPDQISDLTAQQLDELRTGMRKIVISGSGDGGLIDCLRIVHRDFRDGWLAVELAEILGDQFRSKILDAEYEALTAAKSIACMPMTHARAGSGGLALGTDFYRTGARHVANLAKTYRGIVAELPEAATALLNASIVGRLGLVDLVAREPEPFVPYSAPIHKIMVAHAMVNSVVVYTPGEIRSSRGAAVVRDYDDHDHPKPKNTLVIVRHGAPHNLGNLIQEEEATSLHVRQLMLTDYIDATASRDLKPPKDHPNRSKFDAHFIESRYEMAKKLVSILAPSLRISADRSGFSVHSVGAESPERAWSQGRMRAPAHMFGISLLSAPIVESSLL